MSETKKRNVKVVESKTLSSRYDKRFVVVDEETGNVLDDAQGYGYKSKQKAMAASITHVHISLRENERGLQKER